MASRTDSAYDIRRIYPTYIPVRFLCARGGIHPTITTHLICPMEITLAQLAHITRRKRLVPSDSMERTFYMQQNENFVALDGNVILSNLEEFSVDGFIILEFRSPIPTFCNLQ